MARLSQPRACFVRLAVALCLAAACAAQQPTPSAPQDQPEISTHEEKATFTSHVNLVMVPVVVRDKQGHLVEGLAKESFRLFDKGKLQEIERFTVERPGSRPAPAQPVAEQRKGLSEAAAAPVPAAAMPQRFIGYLFDDVHVTAEDLIRVRAAAERHIESELKATDRAAIFTTSGQGTLDFTDDRDQLREALARLVPRPIARATLQECPDISYYQADQIVNHNDPDATAAAATEIVICRHLDPQDYPQDANAAQASAMVEARRVLIAGEQETQVTLAVLKDAVRRMSAMPGERILVLVSPGFLTLSEHQPDEYDAIDRALRANVLVNVLNARGLYTTNIDASHQVLDSRAERTKQALLRQSEALQETLLAEIAADTGGTYFHNNNDLDEGFRRISTTPEVYYLLGFQPQNLKLDGSFHGLKIMVEQKAGYGIEARRGYYAPTRLEDAAATARREIEDAVYSREEMSDLPVAMHTQFFKGAGDVATVTVLAHVNLAGAKFRKAEGRNLDNITVVAALFDRNGNLATGLVKHVDLSLHDEFLQKLLAHGLTVRMGLEGKPGSYTVRLVVRDSEGQLMSALNGTVDIP
ncbi:MAG: VWA domain-containing protein [Bryobacteraceae bacterium]